MKYFVELSSERAALIGRLCPVNNNGMFTVDNTCEFNAEGVTSGTLSGNSSFILFTPSGRVDN